MTKGEIFEVLLAANEAFANAVEHPQEPSRRLVDVAGTIRGDVVTITIRDYGTWQAERQRTAGGYGIAIMEQVMDAVRVESLRHGTRVTIRRHVTPADAK